MNYDEAIIDLIDLENNNNIGYGDLSEIIRSTQEYKHIMLALETAKKEHAELSAIKQRAEEVILDFSHSRNVGFMGSYSERRINYIIKGEKE